MDIAAIITAVAALVAATASWRTQSKVGHELSHNGGGSMKDATARTEAMVKAHGEMIRSLGHQVGEMKDAAVQVHEDHASRLRNLEKRL